MKMRSRHMILRLTGIGLSLIFLCAPASPLSADQLSTILEGVRKRYGHLPGLTVPYEREIMTRSMALLGEPAASDRAFGEIHFRPPHFLRVDQERPTREALISDGRTLWWYVPEKKQVYQYPSSKLGKELKVLGDILQGLRGVEESFVVMLTGRDDAGGLQLEMTPNPPWPDIDHINLSVTEKDYRIQTVEIYNLLGGLTRFKLGNTAVRERFEGGFFTFVPPDGVQLIKEGE
ncbi:MAG: outer membrane lipoprotein carrier protein LolA [Proteobacteria bacterium]|nr:outer membrane lipoprotein carrier protein LolA [Pseudomonadota bacterium]